MENNNPTNSINNSMRKYVSAPDHHDQESGWTMYFDEFFNQENQNGKSCCFSSGLESSLMSDAAFSAAKNKDADNEHVMGFSQDKKCDHRFSFKKRKTKVAVVDDDLEDTASSPAHSPKVCNLMSEYLDKRSDQNNIMDISQENKGSSSSAQMDERNGVGSMNGIDNETELKKKGLCLVPLSMIVDYLG